MNLRIASEGNVFEMGICDCCLKNDEVDQKLSAELGEVGVKKSPSRGEKHGLDVKKKGGKNYFEHKNYAVFC